MPKRGKIKVIFSNRILPETKKEREKYQKREKFVLNGINSIQQNILKKFGKKEEKLEGMH